MSRSGTQLAAAWAAAGSSKTRMSTVEAVLKKRKLTVTEVTGRERRQALKDFQSGTNWLRADAVDQLSEEEAGVIARRLVSRVQARAPLTADKAETLRNALETGFKENFIGVPGRPRPSAEQERTTFLEAAARYLSETELTALREAVAAGYRPLAGEK